MRRAGVRQLSTVLIAVAALAAAGVVTAPAAGAALPPCRVKNATQGTSFATVAGLALTRAIAQANPGDRLDIRGKCVGSFVLDKSLDIYGNPDKDNSTVLDGGRAGRVIVVDPVAVVRMIDLIVTRGYTSSGGGAGIQNVGELTLIRSYVFDNHAAGSGGGILNVGDLTVTRTGVRFNSAAFDGGGMFNAGGGRGIITYRSTIADNRSALGGGGIFSENQLEMHNSLVTRNVTEGPGGGILSVAGLVLDNTPVVGNVPDDCAC
jgi:nitrous oxidase accessory protein NosD